MIKIIVFIHIGGTVLYLAPENHSTRLYGEIVDFYMMPLFHQNWELFGRTVGRNSFHFRYRCIDQSDEWRLFGHGHLNKHHQNRFSGSGKDYYLLSHFSKLLVKETLGALNGNRRPEESLMFPLILKTLSTQCEKGVELEMIATLSPKINEDRGKDASHDLFSLYQFETSTKRDDQ